MLCTYILRPSLINSIKITPLPVIYIIVAWNNNLPDTVSKPGKCQRAEYIRRWDIDIRVSRLGPRGTSSICLLWLFIRLDSVRPHLVVFCLTFAHGQIGDEDIIDGFSQVRQQWDEIVSFLGGGVQMLLCTQIIWITFCQISFYIFLEVGGGVSWNKNGFSYMCTI